MYKVGDKVETPLGSGKILDFAYFIGMDCKVWKVKLDYKLIDVNTKQTIVLHLTENELKPHKSAHDKLIEMGWEDVETYLPDLTKFTKGLCEIYIDLEYKTYEVYEGTSPLKIDLELSRILTQYLEELEND